jgi:hypothetical protein
MDDDREGGSGLVIGLIVGGVIIVLLALAVVFWGFRFWA